MIKQIGRLFQLRDHYDSVLDQQRAEGTFRLTWLLVAGCALWLATVAAPGLIAGDGFWEIILPGTLGPVALIGILVLLRRHRLTRASWLFVGLLLVLALQGTFDQSSATPEAFKNPAVLAIPLVAAGLLLDRRGLTIITLILAGAVGLRAFLESTTLGSVSPEVVAAAVMLACVAVLLFAFAGNVEHVLQRMARERAVLRATGAYIDTIAASHDEEDLLSQTVELIRVEMRYPKAQIFVMKDDDIRYSIRAGLGSQTPGGSLTIRDADRALVAEVARTLAPALTTGSGEYGSRLVAPAQAALTVPVVTAGRLLAVVDVHSAQPEFTDDEIEALQNLAAQLAMHLTELRLVEDLRRTVRQQEAALAAGPARGATPAQGVASRVRDARARATGFNLDATSTPPSLTPATDYTFELTAALANSEPTIDRDGDRQRLYVPVRSRGVTLGAMTFDIPADRPLGNREIELAQLVSERLGLALENARLFEQSQSQAEREHKAGEVAKTLISATDVRAVLALAAESFNEAMGAVATRVTLQAEPTENTPAERPEGVAP